MTGYSNVLGTLTVTPKHVYTYSYIAVFFQYHVKERWGMDVKLCVISEYYG